jgi:histidinol-phosphate aminotransferase
MQATAVRAEPVLLNKNESPFPPLPPVVRVLRAMAGQLNRYGDFKPMLPARIAETLGVPAESVVVGNGSSELLYAIARAALRPGDAVAIPEFSFIVYDIVTQTLGGKVVKIPADALAHDLDGLLEAANAGARMVIACSPNNPTGTVIAAEALRTFIDAIPAGALLLLDEAYAEFLPPASRLDTARLAAERTNLVVLRTFSKLHGLAGMRVGYAIGNPDFIGGIARGQAAFHLSIMAQVAAAESIRHPRMLERRRRYFEAERERISAALHRLELPFAPPSANFYLVDLGMDPEQAVTELARRGVQISTPRVGNYVRASIGAPDENDAFLNAVAELLGRSSPVS